MKPFGTITKYYRFIDDKSKSILASLMDDSSSYYDFVQRLIAFVLERKASPNLAYLAAVQAWWARAKEPIPQIQERYKDAPCVKPWGHVHWSGAIDSAKGHDTVVRSIDQAMDTTLADWIAVELHLLHAYYHYIGYGNTPSYLEPLEKAESLMRADSLLGCFQPLVFVFEGRIREREGDAKGALAAYQRGLELSEANDDILFLYMNLLAKANVLRNLNISVKESSAAFEKLYDLVQDMETPYFSWEVLNDSSLTFEAAGEYDLSISCQQEYMKTFGPDFLSCFILSGIHLALGNGQESLEWINQAFECAGETRLLGLYTRKACALALLGRLEEARNNLETTYPLALKQGTYSALWGYHLAAGIVELARGDCSAALDLLEQALELERIEPRATAKQVTLLYLARAEIAFDRESKDDGERSILGKWLSEFDNYALENDLPGIRIQVALLKSEFYQNHGQLIDAVETLQQALEISNSPGVRTLTKRVTYQIDELNRLLHEQEVASGTKRTQSQGGA